MASRCRINCAGCIQGKAEGSRAELGPPVRMLFPESRGDIMVVGDKGESNDDDQESEYILIREPIRIH